MVAALALLPLAYLVGTFPTAQLVARAHGVDVTKEGSGNPGASNIYRLLGKGPGALVFVGDILKGTIPALGGLLLADHPGAYALGVAAVIGHVYPATRRFKGGRGVATAAGMAFVLYPLISLGLAIAFFAITGITHKASIGSIVIVVALPVLVGLTQAHEEAWEVWALAAMALLIVARHSANLRRLVHGEELRLDLEHRSPGDGQVGDRRQGAA